VLLMVVLSFPCCNWVKTAKRSSITDAARAEIAENSF